MSDRTSAYLFGTFFKFLAEMEQTEKTREMAEKLWDMKNEYDFACYQMEADEALMDLGFARMGIHPEYNEAMVLYRRGANDWR